MGVEGDPNPVFPRRTECGENLVNEVVRTNDNKFSEDEDSLKGRWRCLRCGVDREPALFAGPRKPARVVRRFDARGDLIASEQHLQEEIPGDVRVIVRESADQVLVDATLRRIAEMVETDSRRAAEPFSMDNPIPDREESPDGR